MILPGIVSSNTLKKSSNDYIVVIDMGQSNSEGRAEVGRLILTNYMATPINVDIYRKPNTSATDNGTWQQLEAGVNNTFLTASIDNFGAEVSLCPLIRNKTNKKCHLIKVASGGLSLAVDWDPLTDNSWYEILVNRYFDVAIPKLIDLLPDNANIEVVLLWHQGPADAANSTYRDSYATNLQNFFNTLRGHHALLSSAPLFITKLHYAGGANEATINSIFDAFAIANPNTYLIDISDTPRKFELTTEQKGGVTPTSTDDNHNSYIGQIAKGERIYNKLVEIGYIK